MHCLRVVPCDRPFSLQGSLQVVIRHIQQVRVDFWYNRNSLSAKGHFPKWLPLASMDVKIYKCLNYIELHIKLLLRSEGIKKSSDVSFRRCVIISQNRLEDKIFLYILVRGWNVQSTPILTKMFSICSFWCHKGLFGAARELDDLRKEPCVRKSIKLKI